MLSFWFQIKLTSSARLDLLDRAGLLTFVGSMAATATVRVHLYSIKPQT